MDLSSESNWLYIIMVEIRAQKVVNPTSKFLTVLLLLWIPYVMISTNSRDWDISTKV